MPNLLLLFTLFPVAIMNPIVVGGGFYVVACSCDDVVFVSVRPPVSDVVDRLGPVPFVSLSTIMSVLC